MNKGIIFKGLNGSLELLANETQNVIIKLPDNGGLIAGEDDVRLSVETIINENITNTNMINKPTLLSPLEGSQTFKGLISLNTVTYNGQYNGIHKSTDWLVSTDINFDTIVLDSQNDTINLNSITLSVIDKTDYFIKVRVHTNEFTSEWSDVVACRSSGMGVNAPTVEMLYFKNTYIKDVHPVIFARVGDCTLTELTIADITEITGTAELSFTSDFSEIISTGIIDRTPLITDSNWLSQQNETGGVFDLNDYIANNVSIYGRTVYYRIKFDYKHTDGTIFTTPYSNIVSINMKDNIEDPVLYSTSLYAYENNKCIVTIANYVDEFMYNINVNYGSVTRNKNIITITVPTLEEIVEENKYLEVTVMVNHITEEAIYRSNVVSKGFTVLDVTAVTNFTQSISGNALALLSNGNLKLTDTINGTYYTNGARAVNIVNKDRVSTVNKVYVDIGDATITPGEILVDNLGNDIEVLDVVDDGVREYVFGEDTISIRCDKAYSTYNDGNQVLAIKEDGTMYYTKMWASYHIPSRKFTTDNNINTPESRTFRFSKLPIKGKYMYMVEDVEEPVGYLVDLDDTLWVLGTVPTFTKDTTDTFSMNSGIYGWKKTTAKVKHAIGYYITLTNGDLYAVAADRRSFTKIASNVKKSISTLTSEATRGYIDNSDYLWLIGDNTYGQFGDYTNVAKTVYTNTNIIVKDAVILNGTTVVYIDQNNNIMGAGNNKGGILDYSADDTYSINYFINIGTVDSTTDVATTFSLETWNNTAVDGLVIYSNVVNPQYSRDVTNTLPNNEIVEGNFHKSPFNFKSLSYLGCKHIDNKWYRVESIANIFIAKKDEKVQIGDYVTYPIVDKYPRTPNAYINIVPTNRSNVPLGLYKLDCYFKANHANSGLVSTVKGLTITEKAMSLLDSRNNNTTSILRIDNKVTDVKVGDKVISNTGEIRTIKSIGKNGLTNIIPYDIFYNQTGGAVLKLYDNTTAVVGNSYHLKYLPETTTQLKRTAFSIRNSGGESSLCGLLTDNVRNLYICGFSTDGALGNNNKTAPYNFTYNPALSNIKKMCSMYQRTICLLENGDVYSTGNNRFGVLGLGTTTSFKTFTKVNIPNKVVDICLVHGNNDAAFTLFLDIDNNVYVSGNKVTGTKTPTMLGVKATQIAGYYDTAALRGIDGYMYILYAYQNSYVAGYPTTFNKTNIKVKKIVGGYSNLGYITDDNKLYLGGLVTSINGNHYLNKANSAFTTKFEYICGNVKDCLFAGYLAMLTTLDGETYFASRKDAKFIYPYVANTEKYYMFKPNHVIGCGTDDRYNGVPGWFTYRDKHYDDYYITVDTPFTTVPTALYQVPDVNINNEVTGEVDTATLTTINTVLHLVTKFKDIAVTPRYDADINISTHRLFTGNLISYDLDILS